MEKTMNDTGRVKVAFAADPMQTPPVPENPESSRSGVHRRAMPRVPTMHQAERILDSLLELVVYLDTEMRVLWANRAACRSAKLDLGQVVGRHCFEIWGEGSAPCVNCPVKVSFETRQPQSVEKQTPDGRYWLIASSPVFEADGRMAGLVELALDISDRKTMENALRESETRHRFLVETIPHGIQEIDPEGVITFASPAHYQIYGYREPELIGKSVLDFQISSLAKAELAAHLAMLKKEQPDPKPFISKNFTKEGKIIDIQVDWNYKKDEAGRTTGFISTITDITEKHRASEALRQTNDRLEQRVLERTAELLSSNNRLIREAEDRRKAEDALKASQTELHTIFDHTPVATLIVDRQNRVTKTNLAAMAFASRSEAEMVGLSCGEALGCLHAQDDPAGCGFGPFCKTCKVRATILETLRSREAVYEMEATLPFANGTGPEELHLLISTAPFRTPGDAMAVVCVQDITRRKKDEEKLNNLNKTLVERTNLAEQHATTIQQLAMELSNAEDRERQRLASVLHDDLQQVLAYLKLKLSILNTSPETEQKLGLLSDIIDGCMDRCRNLAHELRPPVLERRGFTAALKWLCQRMGEIHGLNVSLTRTSEIEIKSQVLSSMLLRSVRELLFNVAKHSGEKWASVEVVEGGNGVRIIVKDAGRGCDPASLREKQENEDKFGLFSIEDRVRFLGGRMDVASAPGKGFAVTLSVPIEETSPSTKPKSIKGAGTFSGFSPGGAETPSLHSPSRGPARVLLVDDHELMRKGLAKLLHGREDLQVVGMAANGREAVDLASHLKPDVVLMDISMPVMNGITATATLRSLLPGIRVIGLSMHDDPGLRQAMLDAGAFMCLSKAGSPEGLLKSIQLAFCGAAPPQRLQEG
ncbi:MAG: PAS domain S-box protein [Desulfobacterales bacterium]